MILVTLGTQDKPFPRLLDAIQKAIDDGIIKEEVVVQAGCTKYESKDMKIFDLIPTDEFNQLVKKCRILITHGGVGSITAGLKADKIVIAAARLSKYKEHTNDHQKEIVREFAKAGYLVELKDFNQFGKTYEFAKKFNLPIVQVVKSTDDVKVDLTKEAFTDVANGILMNSGFLDGLSVKDAKKKVINYLEENKIGTKKVNYKLRDWVFSRQRYWGEPIPMIHCDCCGWQPIDEKDLPLTLPEIDDFKPGENGESPLAKLDSWINVPCPKCGKPAKRETDTMPQWAGSSWYFLRYMDPHNSKELASKEALNYWGQVDWYNGGMEHTTLHLLYSRFWHKFLYDIGVVPYKEPYAKRTSHGMILGTNGEKMSKSKGNVINPDDIVNEFGADTFRVYEMFMGPFDQTAPWSMESIRGCSKFLDRVWGLQDILTEGTEYSKEFESMMHKAIKKVSNDIEEMKFNTSVSTFMTMVNEFTKAKHINKAEYKTFLQLLNPFAPHMTEEIWSELGEEKEISQTPWPTYDEAKTIDDEIEIPVQINGKLKATVVVAKDADEETVTKAVEQNETISKLTEGKTIIKKIYVKGKIFNIVVK